MKKRFILLMAIVLGVALVFVACTGGTQTQEPGGTTAKTTEKQAVVEETKPPTKLTMFYQEAGQVFPDGFDHNDNWFFNLLKEKANIEVTDLNVPAYFDTQTKFNLMMSSGNIPDLVERSDPTAMKQYGYEGAFMPTLDIIKNSPVISKYYDEVQLMDMQSQDGVAYVIQIPPLNDDYNMMYCRWDLLEKLGYDEPPTTLDGWADAARKLKAYDPNSIPFSSRVNMEYAWIHFVPFNLPANGSGWMYYPERGKVSNAWEGDNIIKAVKFGKQMYEEGLWDKEFPTTTSDDYMTKKLRDNVLLQYNNYGGFTGWIPRFYNDDQPDVRLMPVDIPFEEGVGVDRWNFVPSVLGPYTFGINANVNDEKLAAIIRYLEVLYSDEVKDLAIYGREGIEYKLEGGSKVPIQPAAGDNAWRSLYGWVFVNCKEQLEYRVPMHIQGSPTLSQEEKDDYLKLIIDGGNAIRERIYGNVGYSPLSLAVPLEDDIRNLASQAREEQVSLLTKAIVGEISLDAFIVEKENFVKKYQHITDEYNKVTEDAKVKYDLK